MFALRLATCLLLIAACTPALEALVSRTRTEVFGLADLASGLLRVDVFDGSIRVEPVENATELKVAVRQDFQAESEAEADRLARSLKLVIERTDTAIEVRATLDRDIHWTFENWPPVRLALIIQVPSRFNLDLFSRQGPVTVGRIVGAVKVRTNPGEIYLRGVDGNVEAFTESGDIVISHCTQDLRLKSAAGYFKVGPVGGRLEVRGGGGELEIADNGRGAEVDVVGGDLQVVYRGRLAGPSKLLCSGGTLRLAFAPAAACSLDLKTSLFGQVRSPKGPALLTVEDGGVGRRVLRAALGGGGPTVQARVSGGSIELLREDALP